MCRVQGQGAGCREYEVHRRERQEHDSGELLSEGGGAGRFRDSGELERRAERFRVGRLCSAERVSIPGGGGCGGHSSYPC